MQKILVPHLGRRFVLGSRRQPRFAPRMRLVRYAPKLPTPPSAIDYTKAAKKSLGKMYLNDNLGDCVVAAGYHVVGAETANAGKEFIASGGQVLADYEAIGGYVPGHPSTDQGCDEQTAFNHWTQHGFANGTKLAGILALDSSNQIELKQAIWIFENLFFGVYLPAAWVNPFPSHAGFVWDVGPADYRNGHAFAGFGYNNLGVKIDTWGLSGTITWAAIKALCTSTQGGEVYVLLTPDEIAKGKAKAPNGLDWAALTADFSSLGASAYP